MASSYEYTPYIWPMLTGAGLGAVQGIYAIWHRNGPGGRSLYHSGVGDNLIGFASGTAAGTQ